MQGTIQKWGNSHAIRLPKIILDTIDLRENDHVLIAAEKNQIIIRKTNPKPEHKPLKLRIEEFYCKDFETVVKECSYEYKELDSGPPVGEEIW